MRAAAVLPAASRPFPVRACGARASRWSAQRAASTVPPAPLVLLHVEGQQGPGGAAPAAPRRRGPAQAQPESPRVPLVLLVAGLDSRVFLLRYIIL
jgi:hypothetical protein